MKRYIILVCTLFVIILNSCQDKSFEYDLYEANVNDVDSVALSTGAYSLIADGTAELEFFVDAYRNVRYEGDDFDTKVLIDTKMLPAGSIKILDESGTDVGMKYTVSDASAGTKTFTAQIGSISSVVHEVTLREKPAAFEKIYVDVIFHVLELSTSDSKYDPISYREIDPAKLQEAIDDLNAVMNNQLGNGPNGASANIEFRLATHKGSVQLDYPGYHKVTYDQSWIGPPPYPWYPPRTYYTTSDFYDKFNDNPSTYIWDPTNYLNVYVLPLGANMGLPSRSVKYQIVPEGEEAMPGMGEAILAEDVASIETTVENYGVSTGRTIFFRGEETTRTEISGFIGGYYSVRGTTYSPTSPSDDYCTDTRRYESAGPYDNWAKLIKTDIYGNKFKANNAMDAITTSSLRNTFTLDQVKRIRYAIENSPVRAHGKSN